MASASPSLTWNDRMRALGTALAHQLVKIHGSYSNLDRLEAEGWLSDMFQAMGPDFVSVQQYGEGADLAVATMKERLHELKLFEGTAWVGMGCMIDEACKLMRSFLQDNVDSLEQEQEEDAMGCGPNS